MGNYRDLLSNSIFKRKKMFSEEFATTLKYVNFTESDFKRKICVTHGKIVPNWDFENNFKNNMKFLSRV